MVFSLVLLWLQKALGISPSKAPLEVVMVGLDAAGKTTILYRLAEHVNAPMEDAMPHRHGSVKPDKHCTGRIETGILGLGYRVEYLRRMRKLGIASWDVGGPESSRVWPLWLQFFERADAFCMVVDASDLDRIESAKFEFYKMIHLLTKRMPVLLLVNKQDLPTAFRPLEIEKLFDLTRRLSHCSWRVQGVSATSDHDHGLYPGIQWLLQGAPTIR